MIRVNTKITYPSDNSVIRVDKSLVGNRRMGSSLIIKDNLKFGVRESNVKFENKVGQEEEIINVETFQNSDRRCDLWLEFENGTKLTIEMIDHREAKIEEMPLQEPNPKKKDDEILIKEGDEKKDEPVLGTE